ncbi:MAG TPA: HEAT repeat domain-containing protein, partial [Terriglobales bacterium]|nr:HEAT repeat domain-containing protein [Terriglobales bacterium]
YDNNPGVRLKALEGLGSYVKGDVRVRNAVLEALMNDSNPGVRTEAIQLLKPVRADGSVRQVLEHLASQDENRNIRTLSRTVLASTPQAE